MNHVLSYYILSFLLILSISCSNKTAPSSMVSSNQSSIEEGYFWIGSSKNGSYIYNSKEMLYEDCFVINNQDNLPEDEIWGLQFIPDKINDLEFLCYEIADFEYKEGFFYKVRGTKVYEGNELKKITVDKVVRKELDQMYERKEEIIIFIGPKKVIGYDFEGREIDCLQVQYKEYRASAEWEGYCANLSGFDYEPGYIYKVKVKRTYISEFTSKTTMDGPGYRDELVTILKRQRE